MKNVKNTVAMITLGVAGLGLGTIACTQTSEGEEENLGTSAHAYGTISAAGKPIAFSGAASIMRAVLVTNSSAIGNNVCRRPTALSQSSSGMVIPGALETEEQALARIAQTLGGAWVQASQQVRHAFALLSADDATKYRARLGSDFLSVSDALGACTRSPGNFLMAASQLASKLIPIGERVGTVQRPDGDWEGVMHYGYSVALSTETDRGQWSYVEQALRDFNCPEAPYANQACSFTRATSPSSSGGLPRISSATLWIDPIGGGNPVLATNITPSTTVAGTFDINASGGHYVSNVRERDDGTGTNRWVVQSDAPVDSKCLRFNLLQSSTANPNDQERWGSSVGNSAAYTVRANSKISTGKTCGLI